MRLTTAELLERAATGMADDLIWEEEPVVTGPAKVVKSAQATIVMAAADPSSIRKVAALLDEEVHQHATYDGEDFYRMVADDIKDNIVPDFDDYTKLREEVFRRLRTHRETKACMSEAEAAGIDEAALWEILGDRAELGDNEVVSLYTFKSGEQDYEVDQLEEVWSIAEKFTAADWDQVSKLMRSGKVALSSHSATAYPILLFDLGFEATWGLTRNGLNSFLEQVYEIINDKNSNVEQSDDRGPETDTIVYRVKHPKFPGYYVADLPASALSNEGEAQRICVGDPGQGYIGMVARETRKILSLRAPSGKTLLTFEMVVNGDKYVSCEQVKGKANRLPGFDNAGGAKKFIKPDELDVAVEVVRHFGLDPAKVRDMREGFNVRIDNDLVDMHTQQASVAQHCGFCRRPLAPMMAEALNRAAEVLAAGDLRSRLNFTLERMLKKVPQDTNELAALEGIFGAIWNLIEVVREAASPDKVLKDDNSNMLWSSYIGLVREGEIEKVKDAITDTTSGVPAKFYPWAQYIPWVGARMMDDPWNHNPSEVAEDIQKFGQFCAGKHGKALRSRDINTYKSFDALHQDVQKVEKRVSENAMKVVLTVGDYEIVECFSVWALSKLAPRDEDNEEVWCVARPHQSHYKHYMQRGENPRFFVVRAKGALTDEQCWLAYYVDGSLDEIKNSKNGTVMNGSAVWDVLDKLDEQEGLNSDKDSLDSNDENDEYGERVIETSSDIVDAEMTNVQVVDFTTALKSCEVAEEFKDWYSDILGPSDVYVLLPPRRLDEIAQAMEHHSMEASSRAGIDLEIDGDITSALLRRAEAAFDGITATWDELAAMYPIIESLADGETSPSIEYFNRDKQDNVSFKVGLLELVGKVGGELSIEVSA